MAELIIIIVVICLGGLAYWLFGDPDRSERLFSVVGRAAPLLMIAYSGIKEFISLREMKVVSIVVWLLSVCLWVWVYLTERAKRRSAQTASGLPK